MMEFTAKARSDANELPVLHLPVGSTTLRYEGRLLDAETWLVFWERYVTLSERYAKFKDLTDAPASVIQRALVLLERESHALYVDYLRAVFPKNDWLFWVPDVVQRLARGHPTNLREAFDAFFSLQARAMGHGGLTRTSPATPTPPDGTSSNASIPPGGSA